MNTISCILINTDCEKEEAVIVRLKKLICMTLSLGLLLSGVCGVSAKAAHTAESEFFGALNYSGYTGLSAVKAAVDNGDYASAKKELVKYYKDRSGSFGFGIGKADENYGMAVLPMRNILTGPYEFDMWQGEFTVTDKEYREYEVDVTERVSQELANGNVSFMLFAGDKQQYAVNVKSKESGAAPVLVVTYDNGSGEKTARISADNDTYISSANTDNTYGSENILIIKEDGSGSNPTGTSTFRTYINFPLSAASNSDIVSAKLVVSAAYDASCTTGDKDVLVINTGDTTWSENSLKWSGVSGSIYSYQNAQVPTWNAQAVNRDNEYDNVTARFWFGRPMAYEYLSYLENPEEYNITHPYSDKYPGEEFGPKLVELMSAFASQMSHGWPRTLETGERLNRWVDIVDALLPTGVFDERPDDFYNIISFMYGDCKYLNSLSITDGKYWWSNWRIVANAGFFKGCEYLRELSNHDTFRTKAEGNVEYTMDLLYNSDMSFAEAGPAYAQWCAELFGDCAIMAEKAGNPMKPEFIEKLRGAARYALNSFYPGGYDSNTGDSNYRDKMPEFEALAEFLNDPVLNAYINGDDSYTDSLSTIYPDANSAYMRSGWNPQDNTYVSFVNNPSDGHYHPDSNQVLMYAYGNPLIVDSGRYSYSSTNSIYNDLRTAAAHNTVEAVGISMGTHSAAAHKITPWADNNMFSFAASTQTGYSGISHTRNVLFFKNSDMYTLVTDYISGSANNTYRQNWHFMPSNNAAANGNTITTDFYNKANIAVVNADADAAASVRSGYFSADYGLVADSEYASFEKKGSNVGFSTVLKALKPGARNTVKAVDTASSVDGSAVYVTGDGDISFYVKNTDTADGRFGKYVTDAKAAFTGERNGIIYGIVSGKKVSSNDTDYIVSSEEIASIGVTVDNGSVAISGEKLRPSTDKNTAIKLYAPDAVNVTLNGKQARFAKDGDYIYAAAIDAPMLGENLITNGDFANGTTDWTNAANGGTYTGTLSDNASYIHGSGKALTNTASGGGSANTTLRRYIPVEPGKTYYMSFYVYNTGSQISTNAFMSAFVPVKGMKFGTFDGVTFRDYAAYGGQNSWSPETQSEVKRARVDMPYTSGMNHKEFTFTIPDDTDYIMLSMFAWTDPRRLYFSDFELREIMEPKEPELIFDGASARAENVEEDYAIIVAQYDVGGALIKITIGDNNDVTIVKNENAASAKAFLWAGTDSLWPIANAVSITY